MSSKWMNQVGYFSSSGGYSLFLCQQSKSPISLTNGCSTYSMSAVTHINGDSGQQQWSLESRAQILGRDPTAISDKPHQVGLLSSYMHINIRHNCHICHIHQAMESLIFLTVTNANTNWHWIWKLGPLLSLSFINPIILCAYQNLSCVCHINQAEAWRLLWTLTSQCEVSVLMLSRAYHICQIIQVWEV